MNKQYGYQEILNDFVDFCKKKYDTAFYRHLDTGEIIETYVHRMEADKKKYEEVRTVIEVYATVLDNEELANKIRWKWKRIPDKEVTEAMRILYGQENQNK